MPSTVVTTVPSLVILPGKDQSTPTSFSDYLSPKDQTAASASMLPTISETELPSTISSDEQTITPNDLPTSPAKDIPASTNNQSKQITAAAKDSTTSTLASAENLSIISSTNLPITSVPLKDKISSSSIATSSNLGQIMIGSTTSQASADAVPSKDVTSTYLVSPLPAKDTSTSSPVVSPTTIFVTATEGDTIVISTRIIYGTSTLELLLAPSSLPAGSMSSLAPTPSILTTSEANNKDKTSSSARSFTMFPATLSIVYSTTTEVIIVTETLSGAKSSVLLPPPSSVPETIDNAVTPASSSASPSPLSSIEVENTSGTEPTPSQPHPVVTVPAPNLSSLVLFLGMSINITATSTVIPVYTPAMLGNAYGGGFVITPSLYATVYPSINGSTSGVPPGYGFSVTPASSTSSTKSTPQDSINSLSSSQSTIVNDFGIYTPPASESTSSIESSGNYTFVMALQPSGPELFEGFALKRNAGAATSFLGFLAMVFFL